MQAFTLRGGWQQQIDAAKKRHYEKVLVPSAVEWNEDETKFATALCIKAETYKPTMLFESTPVKFGSVFVAANEAVLSPCGKFMYIVKTLPRGEHLTLAMGRDRGEVYFTGDVHVPVLSELVGAASAPQVWMSITPFEVFTQRPGIRKATGKVMVGGLGLGWFLNKVAAREAVDEIVLVERKKSIVDWILPRVKEVWPHVAGKLKEVIVGDAIEQIGKHGDGTTYLLDIWDKYGSAKNDRQFQAAKAKDVRVWGWGDVYTDKDR